VQRYLVTGGAGFICSALARQLVLDGHDVRVLDDMSRGTPRRLSGVACDIAYGDVRDYGAVARAMHDRDAVIHGAYVQGTATFYAEPRLVLDVALHGILNVLEACRTTGCGELLLISSSEVYQSPPVVPTPETVPLSVPDPLNPRYSYGGGKIAAEIAALAWQRTGILDRLVIARPHNIYGPDMGTDHVIPEFCLRMNQLTAAQPEGIIPFPIQGSGQETRSFCYIDDCTAQLRTLLLGAPDGIYNAGTMDERTICDVAGTVAACYGREIKIEPGTLQRGSPPRRLPDTARITALGYGGPQVSFPGGVARTAAWYREQG
jgi:nucleoside-diphosphate-sugar epimerase